MDSDSGHFKAIWSKKLRYVCVRMCFFVYMHLCSYQATQALVNSAASYIHIRAHMYVCMYVRICIHTCTQALAICRRLPTKVIRTYARICMYVHTYIHVHRHWSIPPPSRQTSREPPQIADCSRPGIVYFMYLCIC